MPPTTTTPDKTVLTCPKKVLENVPEFILWKNNPQVFEDVQDSLAWMDRPSAEKSVEDIQIIPAAYLENTQGRYCVLERVPSEFSYLDRKLSLISGGHIDRTGEGPHPTPQATFRDMLIQNLLRELNEELGIHPVEPPEPLGMIYTRLSQDSSRHAAFIHRVQAQRVFTQAPEEFNQNSQISGTFATLTGLRELKDRFDPWSKALITHLSS